MFSNHKLTSINKEYNDIIFVTKYTLNNLLTPKSAVYPTFGFSPIVMNENLIFGKQCSFVTLRGFMHTRVLGCRTLRNSFVRFIDCNTRNNNNDLK